MDDITNIILSINDIPNISINVNDITNIIISVNALNLFLMLHDSAVAESPIRLNNYGEMR